MLQLIGRGRPGSEIAAEPFFRDHHERHTSRIFTKLCLGNGALAAVLAYDTALVTPHR